MPKSYTQQDYSNWAFMYEKGTPLVEIQKQTGVSIPTLIRHLKAMGVAINDFQPTEVKEKDPEGPPGGTKNVSLVLAFNEKGQLLFGKKTKSGKWNVPGGHFKKGEFPVQAANRELLEETGLRPIAGSMAQVYNSNGLYVFKAKVSGKPTNAYDPDKEFSDFNWYNVSKGLPEHLLTEMESPIDGSPHVLVHLFSKLKKSEIVTEDTLVKNEPEELSGFDHFYQNEDPKFRMLALKFNDLNGDNISRCMGDPDYGVVKAALGHPLCGSEHITQFLSRPDLENFIENLLELRSHKLFNDEHKQLLSDTLSAYSNVQIKRILAKILDDLSVPNELISLLLNRIQVND